MKEIFDFQPEAQALLRSRCRPRRSAGVMVGDQTIDWFAGKHYVSKGYENYYHGAWQLLKANSYEAEPFLD